MQSIGPGSSMAENCDNSGQSGNGSGGDARPREVGSDQNDGEDRRKSKPDWSRIDRDALSRLGRRWRIEISSCQYVELSRGGIGINDAVQEGIAAVLAQEELPETHDELVDLVVAHSRRTWKSWTKRMREQGRNLDLYAPTLSTIELFDIVCERDEHMTLLTRLYAALEDVPEAKLVLYAIQYRGLLFHETRLIAEETNLEEQRVTNLKRRIVRRARTIMIELTTAHLEGGAA
jgi:hypothetical protein